MATLDLISGEMEKHRSDQLKDIRPYSDSQLKSFYQNEALDIEAPRAIDDFLQRTKDLRSEKLYQLLEDYEKKRQKLADSSSQIQKQVSICDEVESKVWNILSVTSSKTGRCNDGKLVEAFHQHTEAVFNQDQLDKLESQLSMVREVFVEEYFHRYYEVQLTAQSIESHLNDCLKEAVMKDNKETLRNYISVLFEFERRAERLHPETSKACRQWLQKMVSVLLDSPQFGDRVFLLNHILRCPAGVASWAANFIQAPNPKMTEDMEQAFEYVKESLAMLSIILSPVKERENYVVEVKQGIESPEKGEAFLLVDPDAEEGEDVLANSTQLSETDILKFLHQIPFIDIVEFVFKTGLCIESPEDESFERIMLKLLAFSTNLIGTLKQGLTTFNLLRFKKLTDRISLMIRHLVIAVSSFWREKKATFESPDEAMLLRLQVEMDHFVLRSVITVLSCQKYGVWRCLSMISFDGVSESMIWHILWVVFNNGRDENEDFGGPLFLCPYFNTSYWKAKFREGSFKFVFKEKLKDLMDSEVICMLETLAHMIRSRPTGEEDFISSCVTEIYSITFDLYMASSPVAERGRHILNSLAMSYPFLIHTFLSLLPSTHVEQQDLHLDLFTDLPLLTWKPSEDMGKLEEWLLNLPLNSLRNKVARLMISKLNWNFTGEKALFLDIALHRNTALLVFRAYEKHILSKEDYTPVPCHTKIFSSESKLYLARCSELEGFSHWCWNIILMLRLDLFSQPGVDWNLTLDMNPEASSSASLPSITEYFPQPDIHTDTSLVPVYKGFEKSEPMSICIAALMCFTPLSGYSLDIYVDAFVTLVATGNLVPSLKILNLASLHKNFGHSIKNGKLITSFYKICSSNDAYLTEKLYGMLEYQLEKLALKQKIDVLTNWISLAYESTHHLIKTNQSSWFSGGMRGLEPLAQFFDHLALFIFADHELRSSFIQQLALMKLPIYDWKLPSSGFLSSLLIWKSHNDLNNRKCEWLTVLHLLYESYPKFGWLGWLLFRHDSHKMEKIWESFVSEFISEEHGEAEVALRKVCNTLGHPQLRMDLLPLNTLYGYLMKAEEDHPVMPLMWLYFFMYFFANDVSCGSIGLKMVEESRLRMLRKKLNALVDKNHRLYIDYRDERKTKGFFDQVTKFYRSCLHWLKDTSLHEPYIDLQQVPAEYQPAILRLVLNPDANFEDTLSAMLVNRQIIIEKVESFLDSWADLTASVPQNPSVHEYNTRGNLLLEKMDPEGPPIAAHMDTRFEVQEITSCDPIFLSGLISHHMTSLLEETRAIEKQLEEMAYHHAELIETLPKVYRNASKQITLMKGCEAGGRDSSSCGGPALIGIEYLEAVEDRVMSKKCDQTRATCRQILKEMLDRPIKSLVMIVLALEKYISLINEQNAPLSPDDNVKFLAFVQQVLAWVEQVSKTWFEPPKTVIFLLLEAFSTSKDQERIDLVNNLLLRTVLSNPSLVQTLAPRLSPSSCSVVCFLNMYDYLAENLGKTQPHVSFVLLSKFNVGKWLKEASAEFAPQFVTVLKKALHTIGANPSCDDQMSLGLYRKHLQSLIITNFPQNLDKVLELASEGLKSSSVYPEIWVDVLRCFGFFLDDIQNRRHVHEELTKFAETHAELATYEGLQSFVSYIMYRYQPDIV